MGQDNNVGTSAVRYIFALFGLLVMLALSWNIALTTKHAAAGERIARVEVRVDNMDRLLLRIEGKLDLMRNDVLVLSSKVD